jgi:hypothetical protein
MFIILEVSLNRSKQLSPTSKTFRWTIYEVFMHNYLISRLELNPSKYKQRKVVLWTILTAWNMKHNFNFKKFQQDDTVQYFIISCQSLSMFRAYPMPMMTHPRRRLDTHCLSTPDAVSTVNWAPDDGHGICPKHVELLTGNNKVLYSIILQTWG